MPASSPDAQGTRVQVRIHRDGYEIQRYMFGKFLLTSAYSQGGYLNGEELLDTKKDDT